jgi:site-specific DNA recombinase
VHHRTLNAKGVSSPLAGKLFDENDEPLYACGANKGERHYRYYVSRKVIRGSTERRGSGWRLPALQIERAVAGASRQMLGDRPAIATVLQEAGVPIGDLQPALDAADTKSKQLAHSSALDDNLRNLIDRVQLERGGIRVSLNLRTLLVGETDCRGAASLTMTRSVALEMKRRGVEADLTLLWAPACPIRP